MKRNAVDRRELFASVPVPRALLIMAVPTVISQIISLIYNMVDAFFIGRTGNSYMIAATSVTLTMVMLNTAFSNLFGIGAGSLTARLLGRGKPEEAKRAAAFGFWGALGLALGYCALTGIFLDPLLRFLGASDATLGYARSYALIVTVFGGLPGILSLTLAHLLRNAGFSGVAGGGLSLGGLLNVALDPLFMFVLLPKGQEVTGAALATFLSNVVSCLFLFAAYRRQSGRGLLSVSLREARALEKARVREVFSVGLPSAVLPGLFDAANICANVLSAAHNDLVLAAMGIAMKVERVPNAVNIGICQGMLPMVAYNYSSGDRTRMEDVIRTARRTGLAIAFTCLLLFQLFSAQAAQVFINTSGGDASSALATLGWCVLFLRIRSFASPVQLLNYHTSYCMQAMGEGKATLIHACVRELGFYIPFMFLLDRLFGEAGLAAALPAGEACGALFALWMLRRVLRKGEKEREKPAAGG